jgi:hypothetical protein
MKALGVIVASSALWAGIATAQNITNVNVMVGPKTGPWNWVAGGLNWSYQYGEPIGIPYATWTSPTVINATNGFRFSVGDNLTISYVSGLVSVGPWSIPPWPFVDANGDTNAPLNNASWAAVGPSYYMNPATYPIYISELVGTFADNSGQIVGTPFAVGDLGTFTVPTGATQLQLGSMTFSTIRIRVHGLSKSPAPPPFRLRLLVHPISPFRRMLASVQPR